MKNQKDWHTIRYCEMHTTKECQLLLKRKIMSSVVMLLIPFYCFNAQVFFLKNFGNADSSLMTEILALLRLLFNNMLSEVEVPVACKKQQRIFIKNLFWLDILWLLIFGCLGEYRFWRPKGGACPILPRLCVYYSIHFFHFPLLCKIVFLPHLILTMIVKTGKIDIEVSINCETLILELSIWREQFVFHACRSDMTKNVVQCYCRSHSMLPTQVQ